MKLESLGKTKLYCNNIGPHEVEVYVSSRGGYMSPQFIVYRYRDRWTTPLEQQIRNWHGMSALSLLKIFYRDTKLKYLIYDENPLLRTLPRDGDTLQGKYVPIPLIYESED